MDISIEIAERIVSEIRAVLDEALDNFRAHDVDPAGVRPDLVGPPGARDDDVLRAGRPGDVVQAGAVDPGLGSHEVNLAQAASRRRKFS